MLRSWQDHGVQNLGKIFQDHGKIMVGSLQDFDKILARSWWNLGKIVQDHGKIMIESWQDCDKILERIIVGSSLVRSSWDLDKIFQDHGKIMIGY